MSPWLREFAELLHAGHRTQAASLARSLAATGNTAALVKLAVLGVEAGYTREQTDRVIAEAELVSSQGTSDLHWVLFGAYEAGLGSCVYDEKSRRALAHLEAYASLLRDPTAAYAVAVRYGQGTVGTAANPSLARHWLRLAAEFGHNGAQEALQNGAA